MNEQEGQTMKLGIYGGTFNPPHLGHLTSARLALDALGLDALQFVPAATPPHKALPAGSLVINATGLGKDRPGSPLTDHCKFPENGLVWELNYRGTLEFMHQAEAQRERRGLLIEDGWTYFIHGWTQVIAEVFHIDITGERLAACDRLAREMRK